ncbi:hypothetical protein BDV12DRAFT_198055 [Aspergillus spectabilis]
MAIESLKIQELELVLLKYSTSGFEFRLCPPPLLVEILRVNDMRKRASKYPLSHADLQYDALEVIYRLDSFPSETWVEGNEALDEDFKLVAGIFQAANFLYCMSSLQESGVLPISPSLTKNWTTTRHLVYELIRKTLPAFGIAGENPTSQGFYSDISALLSLKGVLGDSGLRESGAGKLALTSCLDSRR